MRTELRGRMVSFSFNAVRFSLPIQRFIVFLNRITGDGQRYCKVYVDDRQLTRVYEKELPGIFPPIYTPRNDSKVFIQDFYNLEEISSYRATFTAEYNALGTRVNRSISMNFYTTGDGKIQ